MTDKRRRPAIFHADDSSHRITITETSLETPAPPAPAIRPEEEGQEGALTQEALTNTEAPQPPRYARLFSWSGLLATSLLGLFTLWAGTQILTGISALFARNDALGWLATGLAVIAALSLLALMAREILSIRKLKKLGTLRSTGQRLLEENRLKPARSYLKRIKQLYDDQPERRWYLSRIKTREKEIMDAREIIELLDTELGAPLDQEARQIISATAKKVSLITAIAPGPILDMAAVTVLNITMIRKIAEVYGVRPGFFGQIRLARNVLAHLALSGGIAVTGDLLSPLIGTSIAAKLSKRLGEGLFNGALTIRIGLSAVDLARPIPYVKAPRLSFAKLVKSSLSPAAQKASESNR